MVLIPDPDGRTGGITVSNRAGTSAITSANHASEVRDATTAPGPQKPLDEREISRIFGPSLAAQPIPPEVFILYFKTGSTDLVEESVRLVPRLLASIDSRKSKDISVVGHSDRVGTREKNYELSLERALRVKAFLVSKGVDSRTMEVGSHGEDNPLIKTPDEVAEPMNRRVEVTVR